MQERRSESKLLKLARKEFVVLDLDGSGVLEGDELSGLARWVFASFNPREGGALSAMEEEVEMAGLMENIDTNGDGSLS